MIKRKPFDIFGQKVLLRFQSFGYDISYDRRKFVPLLTIIEFC